VQGAVPSGPACVDSHGHPPTKARPMRLMPILTAILVAGLLYLVVLERDRLLAFAQVAPEAEPDEQVAVAAPDDTEQAVPVVAMTSTAQPLDQALILRGRTEAARNVTIAAETSGQVVSTPLPKGRFVEQGDILCELDPGTRQSSVDEARARLSEARAQLPVAEAQVPAARATLAEARARLAEAQSRLLSAQAALNEAVINQNAAQRLSQDGFASDTRLANADAALASARAGVTSAEAAVEGASAGISAAEAGVESAQAGVESARAGMQSAAAAVASAEREIDRLTITAPFAGLLETDTAELGSLMQPGTPCATILQLDPIHLVGFVPELEVDRLQLGAMAGARLASGREVRGEVSFISRSADDTTRTFQVEVRIANADLQIRDGQTAEILVASEGTEAHLLPGSALTLDDDGAIGIRSVDADSRARFLPVTVLRDTVDGIWVDGLPDSVDVIVVGQEYVAEGVLVQPTFREADG